MKNVLKTAGISFGVIFLLGFFVQAQEYDLDPVNNNGVANYPHEMAINDDNYPIIVYQDTDDKNNTKIKERDGSSWNYLGASSWPIGSSTHHDIAVGTDGLPVVVYADTSEGGAGRLSTIKRDGSSWNYLGPQWINDDVVAIGDGIRYDHVRIGSDNMPVVEYSSGGINVEVYKWNGTVWNNIGPVSGSSEPTQYQSLALNSDDTPYVAYLDNTIDEVVIREYSGGNWHDFGSHVTGDNLEGVNIVINDDGEVFAFVMDDHGFQSYGLISSSTGGDWVDFGDPAGAGSNFSVQDMVINPFDGYPVVAYKSSQNVSDGDGGWTVVTYSKVSRWNGSERLLVSSEVLNSSNQNLAVNELGQIYLSQGGGSTYFINPYFRGYFGVDSSIYWENLYNPLVSSALPNNGPAGLTKGVATTFTIDIPASFDGDKVLTPRGNEVAAIEKETNKIVYNVIGFKSSAGITVSDPEPAPK